MSPSGEHLLGLLVWASKACSSGVDQQHYSRGSLFRVSKALLSPYWIPHGSSFLFFLLVLLFHFLVGNNESTSPPLTNHGHQPGLCFPIPPATPTLMELHLLHETTVLLCVDVYGNDTSFSVLLLPPLVIWTEINPHRFKKNGRCSSPTQLCSHSCPCGWTPLGSWHLCVRNTCTLLFIF